MDPEYRAQLYADWEYYEAWCFTETAMNWERGPVYAEGPRVLEEPPSYEALFKRLGRKYLGDNPSPPPPYAARISAHEGAESRHRSLVSAVGNNVKRLQDHMYRVGSNLASSFRSDGVGWRRTTTPLIKIAGAAAFL